MIFFRFRFLVRAVSTYIQAQIPSDSSLRITPNSSGSLTPTSPTPSAPGGTDDIASPLPGPSLNPTPQSLQAVTQFENLKTQKFYSNFSQDISYVVGFVNDPSNALPQLNKLLAHYASKFYPDAKYLNVLKVKDELNVL